MISETDTEMCRYNIALQLTYLYFVLRPTEVSSLLHLNTLAMTGVESTIYILVLSCEYIFYLFRIPISRTKT